MKISRNVTVKINYILDHILPPFLRDNYYFMYIPFRLLFGKEGSDIFMNFKERVPFYSQEDFEEVYSSIDDLIIERETDLNSLCIEKILENIDPSGNVLEVGCGRGYLSNLIYEKNPDLTSVDIYIDPKAKENYPHLNFVKSNLEKLPFKDGEFDITVCTHTLEHVQNFRKAFSELRRVTKKKILVVVPSQRPYKYTFDLHLHFFPYISTFLKEVQPPGEFECSKVDGDIFYIEYVNN